MQYLILLLNVLSFWLMADAAHAGPLVAAIGVIAQLLPIGAIGKLFLTVALNIGLSLIEKALAKKDQPQPAGTKLEISMGDDHAMSFIIGSYATAGKRKYAGTWGDDGKTPNAYFTDVIEIGSLPNRAGERGLTSVWIDDQKVGVLWDQPHPDGRGFPVLQYRVKNKDYLWIKFLDGTQSSPDSFLTAKFGFHAERPWKPTMIGRGCQIVILTSRYNTDLFKGVPAGLFEPHPLPLYDVRKDSSVGGNGAHRWADPTTWERSTNPAVMIYNLARGVYYGSEWVYGGQNIGAFCLPGTNWMAAANACDASVALDGGSSEPAFRAGYDAQCDQEPLDAISELLKGCNGRMAEVGGIFKMLVGSPGGAVYSFTDSDIVVTEEQSFQPFPSLSATYNAIESTYPEPAEKWATKDAPGRYNTDLEAQDGNRRLPAQIQLLAVPFANQVQRVGLAMIQDYRRFRVHQVSLPPDAYPLEPNDVVSWSSVRNGYDEKKFLVVKVEPQANFLIVVTLKEVDPADYDWHPGLQLPTAIGWLGPITPPSQPMIGWTVEPATIKDAGGIDRRPAIKISCAPDLDDVAGVWVQVRLKETGDVVFDSDSNPYASPYSWIISGQWTLPNTNYEARGRYLPQSNRATDWSAWLTAKTPNVLIQASDVLDGAIIQSKIADAAVTAAKIMDEAITNLKLADKAVSTAKIEVAAVTAEVLASGAVIASKLADGAVTARALAQGAVDATSLASGIKAVEVVGALPTTGNAEGRQVFLTTDGKLYRYHNGTWTAAVAAVDVNGTLNGSQIADNAITNDKLAALAVDATKFASGIRPIETLSSLPTTGNVAGRTVFLTADGKLYRYTGSAWTAAVAAGDVAGQIVGTQISDGAISTPKLAAGSVTANSLAAGAVTAEKIAANSITAGQIAAGAIGATQIAANAILAKNIVVQDFENLVPNGKFDDATSLATDYWALIGETGATLTMITDPANALAGKVYMRLAKPRIGSSIDATTSAFILVTPNDTLQWETGYKLDIPASAGIFFRTLWYDGNQVALTGTPQYTDLVQNAGGTTAWTIANGKTVVPAAARYFKFQIVNWITNSTGKNLDVAGIAVRRANAARLIVDGGITATQIAAKAITVDKLLVTNTDNQIDLGFSAGSRLNWQIPNLGSYYLETGNSPVGGTWLAQCDGRDQMLVGPNLIKVSPGESYNLSAWLYNTDPNFDAFMGVYIKDALGGSVSPNWISANANCTAKNSWTFMQSNFTVPAGIYLIQPMFGVGKTAANGNWCYWGKPNMRRAAGGELIVDGAIAAGKIAANAITAGTIAAGAVSAAQIAAGAITADKLAAGSVSTQALAVGNGANQLANSDSIAGTTGWSIIPNYGGGDTSRWGLSHRIDGYGAAGCGSFELSGSVTGGVQSYSDFAPMQADNPAQMQRFPVTGNAWYEFSGRYYAQGAKSLTFFIDWFDASGTHITYTAVGYSVSDMGGNPFNNLNLYRTAFAKAQAPANAVYCLLFIRNEGTTATSGPANVHSWFTQLYFGVSNANQTTASAWSPGGVTLISGGNIVTGAITADKIVTNAVMAGKIAAGAVTAGTIAAGAVTAASVAAGSITGDKIAANTIGANQIAAGAITAKTLVLTDFSNMVDNGWQGGNLDGWGVQNLQNFYLDQSNADSAGYVVQSLARDCCLSKAVAVSPGETYAFDVWVYNADANTANILTMNFSGTGAISFGAVAQTTTKNNWVRLQGRYLVPSGCVKIAMLLQVDKTAGTGNSCYWSKPVMRRATSGELIVDGAITANKIAANSISSGMISAGAITADKIATGSITTDKLILGGVTYDKIAPGACTDTGVGRHAEVQNVSSNCNPFNLISCVVTVAGDGRVVIDCMAIAQLNKSGSAQGSQPVGLNIFRDNLLIFQQVFYLPVVRTVVSGGGNGGTSSETYTAGYVGISGFYDAPGSGGHAYTMQINNPGSTIGWAESNISASSYKR